MNMPMHSSVAPMPVRREDNDRILVRRIFDREIPVLGNWRGDAAELTSTCGGTPVSHICPKTCLRRCRTSTRAAARTATWFLLEPNTTIDEIYGGGEIRIKQRAPPGGNKKKTVGKGLRIGSKSPDDVIESIETTDSDWFLRRRAVAPGVGKPASALDMQLFECFTQAAGRSAPTLKLAA